MYIFRLASNTECGDVYDSIGKGYIPILKTQNIYKYRFINIDFLRVGFVFFEMMRSLKIFPIV